MTIYLIQCGQTEWRGGGRIQGRLSLPLSQAGRDEAESLASQLADVPLDAIYCSQCEACEQTADLIASRTGEPKIKPLDSLAEMDFGLWQGMLAEEIKRRQPTVYRQWREEPENVTPPDGENLGDAYKRLTAVLAKITRKHGAKQAIAIIVPPMAAAMLRCRLACVPLAEIWKQVRLESGRAEAFTAPAENG